GGGEGENSRGLGACVLPMSSRDHLFKVLVVGDAAVGKTSLVQRYSQDSFSKHYKSTVGVDFALKVLQWSDSEVVRLQLWDIAGRLGRLDKNKGRNFANAYYVPSTGSKHFRFSDS
uniref:RAB29, member RAS oncogene family n=1 Tax=Sus scrofa TaxID=9823 RepID=A0A8D1LTB9_PIG